MRLLLVLGMCILFLQGCPKKPQERADLGDPLVGLSPEHVKRFRTGKIAFERTVVPEEGLGPLFNAEGCAACHAEPLSGGSSLMAEVHATKFAAPDRCDPLFQEGGPVIQQRGTPLLEAQGIGTEQIPASATSRAIRTTPPLIGFGLVNGIPAESILATQTPTIRIGRVYRAVPTALSMVDWAGLAARHLFQPSLNLTPVPFRSSRV